jgi:hypothetical protein
MLVFSVTKETNEMDLVFLVIGASKYTVVC